MTKEDLDHKVLQSVLAKIEELVGDDFAFEMDITLAQSPESLSKNEKIMAKRFGKIYRLVHAHQIEHSCFDVHEDWRKPE